MIRKRKNILNLVLTALMLCVSCGAWSTTYYLWGGNDDAWDASPSHWEKKATHDGSATFTVTLAAGSWFMGISDTDDVRNIFGFSGPATVYDPDEIATNEQASDRGGRRVFKFQLAESIPLTISYDGANLTLRSNITYYTISTSFDSDECTVTPTSKRVAENGSCTFIVEPKTGFTLTSASMSNANASCDPTDLDDSKEAVSVEVSSVTGASTLTITCTERTQLTLQAPSATGCSITPNTSQNVYVGDPITYTVTPETGKDYIRCSYDNGTLVGGSSISKSENSFTFYPLTSPSNLGQFNVTYGEPGEDIPIIRIGEEIKQETNQDVTVSAYITEGKCVDVDEIVIYYANNSGFRNSGSMLAAEKSIAYDTPISSFPVLENLTLLKREVAAIVAHGETLYVRLRAHNENGYSAYSDVVSLLYMNEKFISTSVTILDGTACDGRHDFDWSTMFVPTPTTYTVVDEDGDDASSEFTLDANGRMVWNVIESIKNGTVNIKPSDTYTYTFTPYRSGYDSDDAEATFTITLYTDETAGEISGIFLNGSAAAVEKDGNLNPWDSATLGAGIPSPDAKGIEKIGWSVSPESDNYILTIIEEDGTEALFKGRLAGTYNITARGLTTTCGSSKYKQIDLTVNNDSEPCGN